MFQQLTDWAIVSEHLKSRIESYGVTVLARPLDMDTTGIFDGLSITTNTAYDLETRCYNMAHSLGHVVQWSLNYPRFQKLYDDLHAAKEHKSADPEALQRALKEFRRYEEEASRYAAWLLVDTNHADVLPSFILFARADIEAIIAFHRDGAAPCWQHFFEEWKARVQRGEIPAPPFEPEPVPSFSPVLIARQEVIREVHESAKSPWPASRPNS